MSREDLSSAYLGKLLDRSQILEAALKSSNFTKIILNDPFAFQKIYRDLHTIAIQGTEFTSTILNNPTALEALELHDLHKIAQQGINFAILVFFSGSSHLNTDTFVIDYILTSTEEIIPTLTLISKITTYLTDPTVTELQQSNTWKILIKYPKLTQFINIETLLPSYRKHLRQLSGVSSEIVQHIYEQTCVKPPATVIAYNIKELFEIHIIKSEIFAKYVIKNIPIMQSPEGWCLIFKLYPTLRATILEHLYRLDGHEVAKLLTVSHHAAIATIILEDPILSDRVLLRSSGENLVKAGKIHTQIAQSICNDPRLLSWLIARHSGKADFLSIFEQAGAHSDVLIQSLRRNIFDMLMSSDEPHFICQRAEFLQFKQHEDFRRDRLSYILWSLQKITEFDAYIQMLLPQVRFSSYRIPHIQSHLHFLYDLLCNSTDADLDFTSTHSRQFLLYAAQYGDAAFIQTLIMRGANFDFTDNNGFSPIAAAVTRDDPGIVQCLLESGISAFYDTLDIALRQGNLKIMKMLNLAGANLSEVGLEIYNKNCLNQVNDVLLINYTRHFITILDNEVPNTVLTQVHKSIDALLPHHCSSIISKDIIDQKEAYTSPNKATLIAECLGPAGAWLANMWDQIKSNAESLVVYSITDFFNSAIGREIDIIVSKGIWNMTTVSSLPSNRATLLNQFSQIYWTLQYVKLLLLFVPTPPIASRYKKMQKKLDKSLALFSPRPNYPASAIAQASINKIYDELWQRIQQDKENQAMRAIDNLDKYCYAQLKWHNSPATNTQIKTKFKTAIRTLHVTFNLSEQAQRRINDYAAYTRTAKYKQINIFNVAKTQQFFRQQACKEKILPKTPTNSKIGRISI